MRLGEAGAGKEKPAGGKPIGDTCGRAGAGRREGLSGRGESHDKVPDLIGNHPQQENQPRAEVVSIL